MIKPNEHNTVQAPLIRYAEEVGWTYVPRQDAVALRKGEGGLLFNRVLEEKLVELNPGLITADNAGDVIRSIEAVRNTIEGNAEILAWLRGEQSAYDESENRERNVTVIDFETLTNNVFHVTDEWQYTNGQETNRADVMFLINGIPVAIVETKNATKEKGIEEGLIQIREYHHETPEMLTAPQVFDITHLIDFYYGATWNLDRKNLFKWRGLTTEDTDGTQKGTGDSFEARVKLFFERDRFLTMLKEWILFFYKEDELQKTVLRQHQTRAVDRILARCADATRATGLIWHTQGSGKTFTMITAARLILQDNETFGKEDDQGYLDKYSIAESIADGTTVPLKYTLAPSEIRVPREQLEKEFLDLAQAEGVSDVDELNKILDHAMRLKSFLKSDARVEKVAAFVAEHFTKNVEPLGYKAFLVAVDREACALYKEALDKILPPEYSLPIYTAAQHDSEKYPQVYKHQVAPDAEKKARKLFPKADTQPKIFIVTDKLLTGFDAPVLYCMYLDKPMRDHVLLQAIARVNRPYERDAETQKPCGVVVDFVGIFEKLEKALAFDSDVVSGVIEDLDLLFDKFKELMNGPAQVYIELCQGPVDDKAVERAIETFSESEKREAFYKLYKQLETLYEILSPSPDLRDFIDDFGCLSLLYQIIRNAFRKRTILYGDVARKTEMLVREKAESYGLETTLSVVKIDENTLEAINKSSGSDKGKIINLVNSVRKAVLEDADSNPYLKPIGDRAEAIMEAYDARQDTTEEALRKIEALIQEVVDAQKQKEEMGFDETTFSFFWTLKKEGITEPERTATIIRAVFERFPHHRDNAAELRQLKAELYRALLPLVGKEGMIPVAEKLLRAEAK